MAQYIIRNPFAVEKMQVSPPNRANPEGSVLYRSGLNPKIQRNLPNGSSLLRLSATAGRLSPGWMTHSPTTTPNRPAVSLPNR